MYVAWGKSADLFLPYWTNEKVLPIHRKSCEYLITEVFSHYCGVWAFYGLTTNYIICENLSEVKLVLNRTDQMKNIHFRRHGQMNRLANYSVYSSDALQQCANSFRKFELNKYQQFLSIYYPQNHTCGMILSEGWVWRYTSRAQATPHVMSVLCVKF